MDPESCRILGLVRLKSFSKAACPKGAKGNVVLGSAGHGAGVVTEHLV